MEFLKQFIDIFLHLDQHLKGVLDEYGTWTYLVLFIIIFAETGFVVTPFLPGDSLLFMVGALAATGGMSLEWSLVLLAAAAILGNLVNYAIGYWVGPKVFKGQSSRWFNRKHLERAHQLYEKHGGIVIIVSRFLPIFRTFAPFVAGIGRMNYWRFAAYNLIGGIGWVAVCVLAGYYFGSHPFVKKNFSLVVLAIIVISLLPAVIGFVSARLRARKEPPAQESSQ